MVLTAVFKLHANPHDRHRLAVALGRWHAAHERALQHASRPERAALAYDWRAREREVLRCLVPWTSKDGARSRLVVDRARLHALVVDACRRTENHLHSSAAMSLIVAVEQMLASYLALYAEWINGGRKTPKPGFPCLPSANPLLVEEARAAALAAAATVATSGEEAAALAEENRWRNRLLRAARPARVPITFGAATSGAAKAGKCGQAHMGLLRRADGRWFALLTLLPQGDTLGEPVQRARNRRDRGDLVNPRGAGAFRATDRARASLMVPLEFAQGRRQGDRRHGRENLFLARAEPRSAELVRKGDDYFLHVAFQFPEPEARPAPNVLAVRRGIATLVAAVLVAPDGRVLGRHVIEGKDLAAKVSAIRAARARRQAAGHSTAGDRKATRVAEEHLSSAARQVRALACDGNARVVLFDDRKGRMPNRFLAYRHFSRLAEKLATLLPEAGLPAPEERTIYGPWRVCAGCGWVPGDPVRHPDAQGGECPGCRRTRDEQFDLALLLAWDTLRFRRYPDKEKRPTLPEFVKEIAAGTANP